MASPPAHAWTGCALRVEEQKPKAQTPRMPADDEDAPSSSQRCVLRTCEGGPDVGGPRRRERAHRWMRCASDHESGGHGSAVEDPRCLQLRLLQI